MELIADILLLAGALGAGLYCFILSRRLNRFNDLEQGVGGAVAVLSSQVRDLTTTIEDARSASSQTTLELQQLTERAETAAQKLELMMASLHDVPLAEASSEQPVRAREPNSTPMFIRHDSNSEGVEG
ncbi:hypothetical protein [Primorskyibacter sp. S87]|uniref:hypothetical protein n=1 Tax=Primorskyibacter sp. S87 TaxID=3415126 RepID=UPI003C7B2E5C